ncbi:MAG: hypothetical protein AAGF73_10410 [Actinomycetota bacterium]
MGVLALWATPRTVSTAFERMMIERADHLVLDEPWSRAYYLGPQRRSERYPLTFPESTYEAIESSVLELGGGQPVFVKDMAYHAAPGITDEALRSMRHTFLIRKPDAALASLHRQWPDFTEDEAGYRAQRNLFVRVVELQGEPPVVIDSDVLLADPSRIVAEWSERIGIEHHTASLTWSSGMRAEWPLWHDWYTNAARSTGFVPPVDTSRTPLQSTVERAVSEAAAHFDALRVHAIE